MRRIIENFDCSKPGPSYTCPAGSSFIPQSPDDCTECVGPTADKSKMRDCVAFTVCNQLPNSDGTYLGNMYGQDSPYYGKDTSRDFTIDPYFQGEFNFKNLCAGSDPYINITGTDLCNVGCTKAGPLGQQVQPANEYCYGMLGAVDCDNQGIGFWQGSGGCEVTGFCESNGSANTKYPTPPGLKCYPCPSGVSSCQSDFSKSSSVENYKPSSGAITGLIIGSIALIIIMIIIGIKYS